MQSIGMAQSIAAAPSTIDGSMKGNATKATTRNDSTKEKTVATDVFGGTYRRSIEGRCSGSQPHLMHLASIETRLSPHSGQGFALSRESGMGLL